MDAPPPTCDALAPLPDTVQVAWVSKVGKRVGRRGMLEVVRVADLRKRVEAENRDATGVLQALGLVGKKARGKWKIVVFDVKTDYLCRPALGNPADDLGGLDRCEEKWQKRAPGTKRASFGGCGYLLDSQTGERTLDVYRIDWEHAAAWGFCVMPLERFVNGA
jgi:hypothetical protein